MRASISRLTAILIVTTGSLLATTAMASEECDVPDAIKALVQSSVESKKSLTVYVDGQRIPILVTKAGECSVEGRNQQFGRIVIRLDRVSALAQS